MKLLDLATLITLWVIALQYMINNFLAQWLKERYYREIHGNTAKAKTENFVRKLNWVILILYIVAVALGTIGLIRD